MRYEILKHTADILIKAYGGTLEECFENAAFGMIDQIVDASKVQHIVDCMIEVEGETLEELLYNFLSETLFVFDARHLVLNTFGILIEGSKLSCQAQGEKFDRTRHNPKQEIKAVTYHMLQVNLKEPSITVLFDV